PEIQTARVAQFGMATRFSQTVNQPMMYVALRTERDRGAVAFVRVALPLTAVEEETAWLRRVVWGTAGLTGVAALALALCLARRITRPIQELTAGAQRIAAGDYG